MDCLNCQSSDTVIVPAKLEGFADVKHCNACGFDQPILK
jgi:hypothetical protein